MRIQIQVPQSSNTCWFKWLNHTPVAQMEERWGERRDSSLSSIFVNSCIIWVSNFLKWFWKSLFFGHRVFDFIPGTRKSCESESNDKSSAFLKVLHLGRIWYDVRDRYPRDTVHIKINIDIPWRNLLAGTTLLYCYAYCDIFYDEMVVGTLVTKSKKHVCWLIWIDLFFRLWIVVLRLM